MVSPLPSRLDRRSHEARSSFVEQSTPALHGIVDGIASVSQISFVDKDLEAQEKHRGDDGIWIWVCLKIGYTPNEIAI